MIKYFDILKQYVNTGKRIPEYQLKKVMDRGKGLANSYFRARIKINQANDFEDIFYELKKYEINYFEKLNPKVQADLIKNISDYTSFLYYAENPDEIVRLIIDAKGDGINSYDIRKILIYSKTPNEFAMIIGKEIVYDYLKSLTYDGITQLLPYSIKPDELIKMIIKAKGRELNSENIRSLLNYSINRFEIANIIINVKGDSLNAIDILILLTNYGINFIGYSDELFEIAKNIIEVKGDKLDPMDINYLLSYSKSRKEIAKMIIKVKGNKLISNDIYYLLDLVDNREKIAREIIKVKGDSLDLKCINLLLDYSENRENTIKLLLNAGVSKDDINKVIRVFAFDIDYIP